MEKRGVINCDLTFKQFDMTKFPMIRKDVTLKAFKQMKLIK